MVDSEISCMRSGVVLLQLHTRKMTNEGNIPALRRRRRTVCGVIRCRLRSCVSRAVCVADRNRSTTWVRQIRRSWRCGGDAWLTRASTVSNWYCLDITLSKTWHCWLIDSRKCCNLMNRMPTFKLPYCVHVKCYLNVFWGNKGKHDQFATGKPVYMSYSVILVD